MGKINYVEIIKPYKSQQPGSSKKVTINGDHIAEVLETATSITVIFDDNSADTFSGYAYHICYNNYKEMVGDYYVKRA